MPDPYRSPEACCSDEETSSAPRGLGALVSEHARRGMIATALALPIAVRLHEDGLAVGTVEIPFDEIDLVFFDFEAILAGPPSVTVVSFAGDRIVIPSDLDQLDAVLTVLDRRVTNPIAEVARTALASGTLLTFGPVVVELDGLVLREDRLCWSDLAHVVAERDAIVFYAVEPRGRFGWARLREIPHPRVLLDVLRIRTRVLVHGLDPRLSR